MSKVVIWLFVKVRMDVLKFGETVATRSSISFQRDDESGMCLPFLINSLILCTTSESTISSSMTGRVLRLMDLYFFRLSFNCSRSESSLFSVSVLRSFCFNSDIQTRASCSCAELRLSLYLNHRTIKAKTRAHIMQINTVI